MIEETYNLSEPVKDRIKRSFGWIVLFREFPKDAEQRFYGRSMVDDAVTLFTKGFAELYYDGQRQTDRVPGTFSLDYTSQAEWEGKVFRLVYTEPTTRICIPKTMNRGSLPQVTKIELAHGQSYEFPVGFKGLVCLGKLCFQDREISEENIFKIVDQEKTATANGNVIVLRFV